MTRSIKSQLVVLGSMTATLWAVLALNMLARGSLVTLGVRPRTLEGLRGILFAPLLHANVAHLAANTVPLLVLGWLVLLRDARHFLPVTLLAAIGAGLAAWMFGAAGSVHIGASGIVFGYFGFLVFAGWFARSLGSIFLSVAVTALWGTAVLGVLPGQPGISWQAHLGGFVAGALAAKWLAPRPH